MANTLFPKFKELLLQDLTSATVKVMLVKSGYTYSSSHQYLSDVSTYDNGRSSALTNITVANGIFDADDVSGITVLASAQVIAVVLYKDTGTDSTSPLIAYIDTMTGLPFTVGAGGTVQIIWDNGNYKIFAL